MSTDIKLVIWDLDETFWSGTLSEGPIDAIAQNIFRVKELTSRGVMNSICSKNDFAAAQKKLEDLEIWDFFVFPSIMWGPKGQQVKDIIARMKLRPVNVLVVDDNALNREEIRYYNDGIHVSDPEDWAKMDCSKWGKNDPEHARLKQYKLLEGKFVAAADHVGDNESFLPNSNIRCTLSILNKVQDDLDRVVEVLNRTNQLNFTKRRFPSGVAQLIHELRRSQSTAYVVHVVDDYGDYGLCGVVSVSGSGVVEDFAFSCRLLDMGVERSVLQHLRSSQDKLVVPFESDIPEGSPDWVRVEEKTDHPKHIQNETSAVSGNQCKVFMPIACSSEVMAPFLQPEFAVFGLPDFAPVSARMIRKERASSVLFWGRPGHEMKRLFAGEYDVLQVSASAEIMYPSVWLPVLGYFPLPITANARVLKKHSGLLDHLNTLISEQSDYFGRRLNDKTLRRQINFCLSVSKIPMVARQADFSPARYLKDLNALRNRLPNRVKLVVSVSSQRPDQLFFKGPWRALNADINTQVQAARNVVQEFVAGHENAFILEPQDDVEKETIDMVGHFTHKQNFQIAQHLKARLNQILAGNVA